MTALVSGSASKRLEAVDEAGAGHRVAADADARRDADVLQLELVQRLVGERAGAAHDADVLRARLGLLGDVAGGDADVALAGADDAGAVRAEQRHVREVALQLVEEPRLVLRGHALGDAHDELDAALGGLHHRVLHTRGRDEDAAGVGAGLGDRVGHRGEDRDALDVGAGLLRVGARRRPACRSRGSAGRSSGPGCR